MLIRDQAAACGESGGDAGLGLVMRHCDVEVKAIPLRSLAIHLLQAETRPATQRIEQVVVTDLPITKHHPPERQHISPDQRVEGDIHDLYYGRIGNKPQLFRHSGDPPRQSKIPPPQRHCHTTSPQIYRKILLALPSNPPDLIDKRNPGTQRLSPKMRRHQVINRPPVRHPISRMKHPSRNLIHTAEPTAVPPGVW